MSPIKIMSKRNVCYLPQSTQFVTTSSYGDLNNCHITAEQHKKAMKQRRCQQLLGNARQFMTAIAWKLNDVTALADIGYLKRITSCLEWFQRLFASARCGDQQYWNYSWSDNNTIDAIVFDGTALPSFEQSMMGELSNALNGRTEPGIMVKNIAVTRRSDRRRTQSFGPFRSEDLPFRSVWWKVEQYLIPKRKPVDGDTRADLTAVTSSIKRSSLSCPDCACWIWRSTQPLQLLDQPGIPYRQNQFLLTNRNGIARGCELPVYRSAPWCWYSSSVALVAALHIEQQLFHDSGRTDKINDGMHEWRSVGKKLDLLCALNYQLRRLAQIIAEEGNFI